MTTQSTATSTQAEELSLFQAWKGYELPALNAHGQFHQDWLHREFVAFKAGLSRRAAAPSVQQPEAPTVKPWQERVDWTSEVMVTKLMVAAMKAEIAEWRAAATNKTEKKNA